MNIILLVINRGLRKSGGKGKKHDKEAMRASLDSRYAFAQTLFAQVYNNLKEGNIANICSLCGSIFLYHLLMLSIANSVG